MSGWNAPEDVCNPLRDTLKTGLFARFAHYSLGRCFTGVDPTARQVPAIVVGSALKLEVTRVISDKCAHTGEKEQAMTEFIPQFLKMA